MVSVVWLVGLTIITFTIGYFGYSRYLASQIAELDDANETPAHKYQDGQEYVPSKKPVLLGHHFSSIAGGAPIAGPITAVAAFGWLPALLWVAIGNPILGAVHDFMALSASIRHEGKSIGYVIGEYVGKRGKNMLLVFAFLLIVLVVAAFVFLIATVLNSLPSSATATILYIGLAILFGIYLYQLNGPFLPGAIVFIAAIFAGVWVGIQYPIALFASEGLPAGTIALFGEPGPIASSLPLAEANGANFAGWAVGVVLYSFIAATLPVWVLLQPRDFLTSSLLYSGIGAMLLGVVVGVVAGFDAVEVSIAGAGIESVEITALETQVPAFTGFVHSQLGPLFPFLFVTIACGTISGFHSLVSSGTTAKQLDKESDARLIGYGGMLGEGLLALTAIIAVSIVAATTGSLSNAIATFPAGGGALLTTLGIPVAAAATFIALVFLSFLLTSTDTAMRLGRYMVEELIGTPDTSVQQTFANRYVNAGTTAVLGYLLVASDTWGTIWPLFGGANQALAALALLVATVWLANWDSNKQLLSTGVPLVLMLSVTITALLVIGLYRNPTSILEIINSGGLSDQLFQVISLTLQSVIALVLVALAIILGYMGYTNIQSARTGPDVEAVADGGQPEDASE